MKQKLMTTAAMVRAISSLTDVPAKKVKEILTEYETIVAAELLDKGAVRLGLLGRIKLKLRKQRIAMDLKTGERILVPAKVQPKFVFSKALKDIIAENVTADELAQKLAK